MLWLALQALLGLLLRRQQFLPIGVSFRSTGAEQSLVFW